MAVTETTRTSWITRLGDSFKGVLTGLAMFIAAFPLLFWNEGRAVATAKALAEGESNVVSLPSAAVDQANEGKLIHFTGKAETQDVLTDSIFGISLTGIRLERSVEMYQWEEESHSETRKKLGGGEETVTTYTYKLDWSSRPIDTGAFHDPKYQGTNTVLANFEDMTQWAPNVTFGAYTLPDFLKHSIGGSVSMNITSADVDIPSIAGSLMLPSDEATRRFYYGDVSADQLVHAAGSTIYLGVNPGSPKVGDVRVSFKQTPPADISIIAQVIRDTFEPYTASNGYTFSKLSMGKASMAKMFEDAKSSNNIMAWVLRVIGILVVVAGIRAIFTPLEVLADVVPLVGNIVGAGVGIVAWLLGLAWSCIVIAVAWVRFRPIVAGCLLAAAVALVGFLFMKGRKKAA